MYPCGLKTAEVTATATAMHNCFCLELCRRIRLPGACGHLIITMLRKPFQGADLDHLACTRNDRQSHLHKYLCLLGQFRHVRDT